MSIGYLDNVVGRVFIIWANPELEDDAHVEFRSNSPCIQEKTMQEDNRDAIGSYYDLGKVNYREALRWKCPRSS